MSWYNLNGTVVEIKGLEDSYYHDVLRIPNWPTQQAASSHVYKLNAAQDAAIFEAAGQVGSPAGSVGVSPVTGGAPAGNNAAAAGQAGSNLAHDLNPANWIASITGISGHNLLVRGLKIIIGGVLLIAGIMKMTGADKTALGIVTQTAGKRAIVKTCG